MEEIGQASVSGKKHCLKMSKSGLEMIKSLSMRKNDAIQITESDLTDCEGLCVFKRQFWHRGVRHF